jgi:xanthine/CO dehydrogenase XdhC/CoxF family maturation factor
MSEWRALVDAARALRERSEPYFVATVVDVQGSSYRKPGARMLFTSERWLAGSVSGGCLERDILAKGAFLTRDGGARLVTYDGAVDERSGSGCDGTVHVLIERSHEHELADPVAFAARCLRTETTGVRLTVYRSRVPELSPGMHHVELASGEQTSSLPAGRWRSELSKRASDLLAGPAGRSRALHSRAADILVDVVVPPVHLFLFGSAHDAVPLVALGKAVGWSVTVYEPHTQPSTRERFRAADQHVSGSIDRAVDMLERCARPAAVVMSHDYQRDLMALEALLRSSASYIGLLGSRDRCTRLLSQCGDGSRSSAHGLPRVHAPVGLAIGAESPSEIALAIVAQVQAVQAERAALSRVERPALASFG